MIFRVFKNRKRSIKGIIYTIFFCVVIWMLFLYIIYNFLFGLQNRYNYIGIYKHVNYDIVINMIYSDYFNSLEENRYKAVLKTFETAGGVYKEDDTRFASNNIYVDADSLSRIFTFFPRKNFVKIDNNLLKQKNAAFISANVARNFDISIGDILEVRGPKRVVAGIYDTGMENVLKANLIMLWDGKYTDNTENSHIEEGELDWFSVYSKIYILSKNYKDDLNRLGSIGFNQRVFLLDVINTTNPQYDFKEYLDEYKSEWAMQAITDILNGVPVMGIESINEYKTDTYTTKDRMYATAVEEYKREYNMTDDTFYSGLCLAALFTVCILESYRHAKQNQLKVGVLRTLGFRQSHIFIYYFMRSFIKQTAIMICAVAASYILTYKSTYRSIALVTEWILGFEVVIAIAAALSAFVSMKQLRDKTLLIKLNEER